MNIVLFQEITTDEALTKLEAEGEKYTGLFCDMDNKEERKYVKDNAALISNLLKKLDRARIEKARDYKAGVEKEAGEIRQRLEAANLHFTLLIDEHKAKRAKILEAEKAKADAIGLAIQIAGDHNEAILIDKVETYEKAEREQARTDNEARIASEAAGRAVQQEKDRQASKTKVLELERLQRQSDKQHVSDVWRAAKESLMTLGLSEWQSKMIVKAIHNGSIANVEIKY
jgi:stalled ribosome alternative rescue factor ArfA